MATRLISLRPSTSPLTYRLCELVAIIDIDDHGIVEVGRDAQIHLRAREMSRERSTLKLMFLQFWQDPAKTTR